MKVRKPSQKTKILTSLSFKKAGLIELEPLMQYVSSPLRSELCAREDLCDCHLIGVFGCNAPLFPSDLRMEVNW